MNLAFISQGDIGPQDWPSLGRELSASMEQIVMRVGGLVPLDYTPGLVKVELIDEQP